MIKGFKKEEKVL